MKFSLRSLLVAVLLSALLAIGWTKWQRHRQYWETRAAETELAKARAEKLALLARIAEEQQKFRIGRDSSHAHRIKKILAD